MLPRNIVFTGYQKEHADHHSSVAHSMTHPICRSEADVDLPYFQHLWRTLLLDADPRTSLEHLFEQETTEFGLNNAFLSHIDIETETERFEIVHGTHEMLTPGTTVPLSKTYCRKTITDPEGTVAVSDALAEGWGDDPAYNTFELGSYLGTTVIVDDDLYGTLCFANSTARGEPINDTEKTLVEMYGQWIEYRIALSDEPRIRETSLDSIEERAISSEAIDLMMDALSTRTRRVILMSLVGNTTEISLATLERRVNDENARIRLIHTHLPKLTNDGYIEWDRDSATVSKGPRFSEVEPLVQRLKEYNTTFSE